MLNLPLNPMAGDVWYASLDPTQGREQAGFRPVIVVSNDWFNQLENSLVYVVPLTTRNRGLNLHVEISAGEGGLPRDCVAMCDQMRSLDVSRLKNRQGKIDSDTLARVRQIIAMIFADDPVTV